MNKSFNSSRTAQSAQRLARPLPLDLRDYRAPETLPQRLWRKSEPHRYFWTPVLFCATLFCALLLANFITWRI